MGIKRHLHGSFPLLFTLFMLVMGYLVAWKMTGSTFEGFNHSLANRFQAMIH